MDVGFIEEELKRSDRSHLGSAFNELKAVCFESDDCHFDKSSFT